MGDTLRNERKSPARLDRGRWAVRIAVAAAVLAGLAAVAYAAAFYGVERDQAGPRSGVRGTVVRVPLEDIGSGDVSRGEPVAALVRITDLEGDAYARTTADAAGRFTIDLLPGRYLVSAMSPIDTALPVSDPLEVTVHPNEHTIVWLALPASPGPELGASPDASL